MNRVRWFLFRAGALLRRQRHVSAVDDELRFHVEEEAEQLIADGVPPEQAYAQARRSLGNPISVREQARDVWTWPQLEQLWRDIGYGWRQIVKSKTRSAAAILSLALALGACTTTFTLIDALLYRPLAIEGADRLYVLTRHTTGQDGLPRQFDGCEYPLFERMRADVTGADLLAVSYARRLDVTYRTDLEMEKAHVQYVSGALFSTFGLTPAHGRLLTPADDRTPGAHPLAVITHAYWTRRFNRDPEVVGRSIRIGLVLYEIVGVVEESFTGTEPGLLVDVLVPAVMHEAVANTGNSWLRLLARVAPGASPARVRDQLQAHLSAYQRERVATFTNLPPTDLERKLNERAELEPAASGVSGLQERYRSGLGAVALLVGLVLLVACTNVGNLMIARTAARAREMALRVSLGASRRSLTQLVLAESAWIAVLAAILGTLFAVVAGPHVVARVNPPDNPAHLLLRLDWRAMAFVLLVTASVTALFGLAPAWVALRVTPAAALRGGHTPRTHRRLMHALVLVQVAFCFLVVFVGGLFVTTLTRLADQPLGFSPDRVVTVYAGAAEGQPPVAWEQVRDHLGALDGVEAVALGDRALLDGDSWNNYISINGAPPAGPWTFMRAITPGWLETMRMPLLAGRDLRVEEQHPGAAVVNETFAKTYFGGENPVGRSFGLPGANGSLRLVQIVGLTRDARYRNMREPILPVAYVPFREVSGTGSLRPRRDATFIVRTRADLPPDLAARLRLEVPRAHSAIHVSNIRTQTELVEMHTVRERLLAVLGAFFASVALLLSAVGLYGVVDYAVLQRRRDIGICLALGAPMNRVVRMVMAGVAVMALAGCAVGLTLGLGSEQYIGSLLFEVTATDASALAAPMAIVLVVVVLACTPPVVRALRTDLTATIRAD